MEVVPTITRRRTTKTFDADSPVVPSFGVRGRAGLARRRPRLRRHGRAPNPESTHHAASATSLRLPRSANIVTNIVMATSIHLPSELLAAVDRKARSLRISRNQLIVRALERAVAAGSEWSPGFAERLAEADPSVAADVDELLDSVLAARRSKPSPL